MSTDCRLGAVGHLPCRACHAGCAHQDAVTQPPCPDGYGGYLPCPSCRPGCAYHARSVRIEVARAEGAWPDGSSFDENIDGMPAGAEQLLPFEEPPPAASVEPGPPRLSEAQAGVTAHLHGPALVIAGAGSGKTTALTERIVRLVQSGVDPSKILGLTFTRKAAREMRERIRHRMSGVADRVTLSTFHSLGLDLCRSYAVLVGRRPGFSIWDDRTTRTEMRRILREIWSDRGVEDKVPPPESILKALDLHRESGGRIDPEFLASVSSEVGEWAPRAIEEYESMKQVSNALDFGDLVRSAVDLLASKPQIRDVLHQRWTHLMVDEYQDTNNLQETFLSLLLNGDQNLLVVGDEDQAIYRFRGSNVRHILTFMDRYPTASLYTLGQNYRSQSRIVEAAARLVSHNTLRRDKRIWTENEPGSPVRIVDRFDAADEASSIALAIARSIRVEHRAPREHVVLVRMRRQIPALQMALSVENIEYATVGERELHQRQDIRLVLAWWRMVTNPKDLAAASFCLSEWPKLGAAVVASFQSMVGEGRLIDVLPRLLSLPRMGASTVRGQSLVALGIALRELEARIRSGDSLRALAWYVFDVTGMSEDMASMMQSASRKESEEGLRRAEVRDVFIGMCPNDQEPGKNQVLPLQAFVDSLLMQGSARIKGQSDRVTISTIHSAKGLEWDHVWIAGVCDGILPCTSSSDSSEGDASGEDGASEDEEEERRLLYVAVTRARHTLCLSWFKRASVGQNEQNYEPSRFLDELRSEQGSGAIRFVDPARRRDLSRSLASGDLDEARAVLDEPIHEDAIVVPGAVSTNPSLSSFEEIEL